MVERVGEEVKVEVTVRLSGSLLEMEGAILEATNAVGRCVTEEALMRFDTDGSAIRVGEIKLTARGRDPKEYQTPYGAVQIERFVYQSPRGGRIYWALLRLLWAKYLTLLVHKAAFADTARLNGEAGRWVSLPAMR